MELYLIFIGLGLLSPILFLLYLQISSPSPPTTSSTTLRDKEGYVIKEIRPENISGKVKLIEGSKIWSATADEKIENGTRVRVSEVEGVHLKVDEIVGLEEGLEEFPPIEREIGEEMICPNCGSMLPPEAEECSVCGEVLKPSKEEELEEMEEPEEIPPIEREIEEEIICSTCGSVNPPEAEECSVCGEVLKPSKEEELEEMEEPEEIPPIEREIKEIENLEELEKEIEEEDVCPTCGSIILIDVEECPECGEKLREEKKVFSQFFKNITDSIRGR